MKNSMKRNSLLLAAAVLIVLAAGTLIILNEEKPGGNGDVKYCSSDSDCVPAQCCHPFSTVNKKYAPDCSDVMCNMICAGPLDCGAGRIACASNGCTIVPSGNETTVYLSEGQREGPLLVQKIYPNRVEGLNFIEYPLAVGNGTPITLHVGQSAGNGCTIMLTLLGIEGGRAKFLEKIETNKPCPICLSKDTMIGTPNGPIRITDLREGMEVWTADNSGVRMLATVLKTSKTAVPQNHMMIHLVLADGRELFASPGHPLADGRILENIKSGDIVDGSAVASADSVQYGKEHTYDILPSGNTGAYWANGILVGSTLVAENI